MCCASNHQVRCQSFMWQQVTICLCCHLDFGVCIVHKARSLLFCMNCKPDVRRIHSFDLAGHLQFSCIFLCMQQNDAASVAEILHLYRKVGCRNIGVPASGSSRTTKREQQAAAALAELA